MYQTQMFTKLQATAKTKLPVRELTARGASVNSN
jgi:hypothetical protein